MAKKIVERNQAFVEKVLNENEQLLLAYDQLKQELAETKFALNNSRKETIKSMEPKIAQLLENHKSELAKQKEILEAKHEAEIAQIKSDAEKTRLQLISQNAATEEHCQDKLQKMKERALNREQEIKDAYNKKIAQINLKIEEAKQEAKAEEEVARSSWQKMITEKIRQEFQEKAENDAQRAQNRQQKMLMDVVAKVERDAHEESRELQQKLDKETKEHKMVEQRLRKNIENLEQQVTLLKESDKQEKHDLEDKVLVLTHKLSLCKCKEYQQEIENLKQNISDYSQEIERLKGELEKSQKEINKQKAEKAQLQNQQIQQDNEEKDMLIKENESLKQQILQYKDQLQQMDQKHKSEMALVAERVKKTIQTKDMRIQQLMYQFEKIQVKF